MVLFPVGSFANVLWYEIPFHSKYVELGEFIVMPNHIHGVLRLTKSTEQEEEEAKEEPLTPGQKRFQNQGKNTLSSILGSYKSAVTKYARRLGFEFAWQSRFWDHIIRSAEEHERIAQYIRNNPKNWIVDKLNGGQGNLVLEPQIAYNEEDWMI